MSSKEEATNGGAGDADKELDALLNSALQDFDKPPPAPAPKVVEIPDVATEGNATLPVMPTGDELMDSKWTEEFIRQAAARFEQNMASLLGHEGGAPGDALHALGPEALTQNFQRMAEVAASALGEGNETDGDFSSVISQTLRNLSDGAENLQAGVSEEEIMNMFGGLGLGGDQGDAGNILPLMQTMMQSLLSKEILYPALKDIVDKYPAWLEANSATLEPTELTRFTNQKDLMTQVCNELVDESDSDSPEQKTQRFNKILELMQKMQDCGQPPTDLVGDLSQVVSFDESGNPRLPGMPPGMDPSNCSIM